MVVLKLDFELVMIKSCFEIVLIDFNNKYRLKCIEFKVLCFKYKV